MPKILAFICTILIFSIPVNLYANDIEDFFKDAIHSKKDEKRSDASTLFKEGRTLNWKASSGDHGKMKVEWRSGKQFRLSQTNKNNRAAGKVTLRGKIEGNRVTINNPKYNEVWKGRVQGKRLEGEINKHYTFDIWQPTSGGSQVVKSSHLFKKGNIFRWNTASGRGKMVISWSHDSRFGIDQTNRNNRSAGTVVMNGKRKGNKVIIENPEWNETWVGTINKNGKIVGKINGRHKFNMEQM